MSDQQQLPKTDNGKSAQERGVKRVSNQNISIISLSKLKNYMPQNQSAAAKYFASANISQVPVPPIKRHTNMGPQQQIAARYRSEFEESPNQSLYFGNDHEKLATVKALSLTSQLNLHDCAIVGSARSSLSFGTGLIDRQVANQVAAQAQQANHQQRLAKEQQLGDSSSSSQSITVSNASKGVEFGGVEVERQYQRQQQQQLLSCIIEERKRNKIDLQTDKYKQGKEKKDERKELNSTIEAKQQGLNSSGYSRNNMTPSSVLLLQNYNHIEQQQQYQIQHQQQKNIVSRYAIDNSSNISSDNCQKRADDTTSFGQSRTSANAIAEACDAKKGDGSSQPQPQSTSISSCRNSSSSLMLTNINQFKASDSIGNPSVIAGNTPNNNTLIANIANSSDYIASQDLNQIHNQRTEADLAAAPSDGVSSLQHSYQQSLASCHFKDSTTATEAQQFVNYSATQTGRQVNSYHQNFQASMLGQQIKLDNQRTIFEENNPIAVNQGLHMGNSNVESLDVARNLARQQTRTNIDQYYNTHYNLMPQITSKSSSPASSASSPSPKTNNMHSNTSQHSNQIISTNPSSAQIHLGPMTNHYATASMSDTSNLNHQQHQANQHYPYNQQTTNSSNHQHLAISHEQAYAHHHQQQLHPSQQHEHHHQSHHMHQQQQHQQQHSQQQLHHQQTIPNQQAIYHHLANNNANMTVNHIYGNAGSNAHYQGHLQASSASHQTNQLMQGAHQSHHLNSAAAACAAAVVSQTLKTVAHQHSQQHQYGGSITSGFNSTGNLMNITNQHHQQFHPVNQLNNHQLGTNPNSHHHQQQSIPLHHAASMVTRKYECKMCPQVFMSKAEMKYHNQNHMREAKPYKCLQCPKAFANSSYLSQHMRIHQGVKPYTCDICSRKFTQLSHLQQHKRTHTGDKPYKCNYMNCTKQFSQLSNLQSHSRCHQLDKPYKCNSCYKCFHDEQSLLEHIPRHLESKHLKKNLCIFCGSSYQQERGLVKHFQQYHTDKKPTLVAAAIAAGTTGNSNLIASIVSSATPNVGGSSSSSSISSVSSSGSVNVHNNLTIVNVAQGASGDAQYKAALETNHYC